MGAWEDLGVGGEVGGDVGTWGEGREEAGGGGGRRKERCLWEKCHGSDVARH